MKYIDYINLGFERFDCEDNVELEETGYGGYVLTLQITDRMQICVDSQDLTSPKLYLKRIDSEDNYHIIPIPQTSINAFKLCS